MTNEGGADVGGPREESGTVPKWKVYEEGKITCETDRVRPADYRVPLHEVNKLSKSKASWSSIIPKWEVGELE